ncbi:MAG TPA: cytochrome C biogenesis protein, partial [Hyphomicrobiaceae bacterium]|nr:cytochrome C biogenesis protein [Hyphomicrobiaceae bacterium]
MRGLAGLGAMLVALGLASPAAAEVATPWADGHKTRGRLVAGTVPAPGGPRILAGLEIELADGWKTYWRT